MIVKRRWQYNNIIIIVHISYLYLYNNSSAINATRIGVVVFVSTT